MFHFRSRSSEVPSTEEDTKLGDVPVILKQLKESQNYEGKTPEMSSVTRLISPRRGDILEGELGPYIPSSPVRESSLQAKTVEPELQNRSERGTEKAVRTTGEVHFGDVESTDGPTTPSPVLGVVAESTDELTTPHPITIQLERNRPDLSQDWTDGKRTPAGACLLYTSDAADE